MRLLESQEICRSMLWRKPRLLNALEEIKEALKIAKFKECDNILELDRVEQVVKSLTRR